MDLRNGSLEPPASAEQGAIPGSWDPTRVASLDRTAILARTSPSYGRRSAVGLMEERFRLGASRSRLASAPRIFGFTFDSDEHGNIIVVWTENDRIWSRAYSPVSGFLERGGIRGNNLVERGALATCRHDQRECHSLPSASHDPTRSTWVAVYEAGKRLGRELARFASMISKAASQVSRSTTLGTELRFACPRASACSSEDTWSGLGGNRRPRPRAASVPAFTGRPRSTVPFPL